MSPGLTFLVSALQDQGSAWLDELIGIQVEFHHRSCKVGAGSQQALVQVSNWTCGRIQKPFGDFKNCKQTKETPNSFDQLQNDGTPFQNLLGMRHITREGFLTNSRSASVSEEGCSAAPSYRRRT